MKCAKCRVSRRHLVTFLSTKRLLSTHADASCVAPVSVDDDVGSYSKSPTNGLCTRQGKHDVMFSLHLSTKRPITEQSSDRCTMASSTANMQMSRGTASIKVAGNATRAGWLIRCIVSVLVNILLHFIHLDESL